MFPACFIPTENREGNVTGTHVASTDDDDCIQQCRQDDTCTGVSYDTYVNEPEDEKCTLFNEPVGASDVVKLYALFFLRDMGCQGIYLHQRPSSSRQNVVCITHLRGAYDIFLARGRYTCTLF